MTVWLKQSWNGEKVKFTNVSSMGVNDEGVIILKIKDGDNLITERLQKHTVSWVEKQTG